MLVRYGINKPNLKEGQVPVGLTEVANGKYVMYDDIADLDKQLSDAQAEIEKLRASGGAVNEVDTKYVDDLKAQVERLNSDLAISDAEKASIIAEREDLKVSEMRSKETIAHLEQELEDLKASITAPKE